MSGFKCQQRYCPLYKLSTSAYQLFKVMTVASSQESYEVVVRENQIRVTCY